MLTLNAIVNYLGTMTTLTLSEFTYKARSSTCHKIIDRKPVVKADVAPKYNYRSDM